MENKAYTPEEYHEALQIVKQCIKRYGYFTLKHDTKYGSMVFSALTLAAQGPAVKPTELEPNQRSKPTELEDVVLKVVMARAHTEDYPCTYEQLEQNAKWWIKVILEAARQHLTGQPDGGAVTELPGPEKGTTSAEVNEGSCYISGSNAAPPQDCTQPPAMGAQELLEALEIAYEYMICSNQTDEEIEYEISQGNKMVLATKKARAAIAKARASLSGINKAEGE